MSWLLPRENNKNLQLSKARTHRTCGSIDRQAVLVRHVNAFAVLPSTFNRSWYSHYRQCTQSFRMALFWNNFLPATPFQCNWTHTSKLGFKNYWHSLRFPVPHSSDYIWSIRIIMQGEFSYMLNCL